MWQNNLFGFDPTKIRIFVRYFAISLIQISCLKMLDRKNYPKIEQKIKETLKILVNQKDVYTHLNKDVDLIFDWWISNDSIEIFKQKRTLPKLF